MKSTKRGSGIYIYLARDFTMAKQHGNSKYTKAIADKICKLVSDGSNLEQIGQMKDFPCKHTIRNWFKDNKDFFTEYTRAREERADWRANRMDTICQELREGVIDHQIARVLMDNDKWQAGKENPKRYGDKTQLTGDGGGNVVVEGITRKIIEPKNTTGK